MSAILHHSDCLAVMATMPSASVDAIVTDPPYGLSFMGKRWDYDVPTVAIWAECLRVLKPGGYLLAFAGTRTQHRMAVRIEDAGFEIRDMIAWVYGSGFPKSLDVSKAIDAAAGAERPVVGLDAAKAQKQTQAVGTSAYGDFKGQSGEITVPATDAARRWQGWGTALKPAMEPITVARKPLVGTVAENVLEHGTGAINIDGCRVPAEPMPPNTGAGGMPRRRDDEARGPGITAQPSPLGRWPANLIHDGSDEVVELLPAEAGAQAPVTGMEPTADGFSGSVYGSMKGRVDATRTYRADSGSAARFFYCAKASRTDRNDGCGDMEERPLLWSSGTKNPGSFQAEGTKKAAQNNHPTVKPTALMRYLVRLITPPGGVVLDPFMGSGSTGRGAVLEGFRFIGIERDAHYVEISRARIAAVGGAVSGDSPKPEAAPQAAAQGALFA